jgi:ribosome-associated protein
LAIATVSKAKAPAVKKPRKKAETKSLPQVSSEDVRLRVIQSLEDDKADEIVIIPLIGRSALADYMVIASGKSTRQVAAMAEHLRDHIGRLGLRVRIEGKAEANWVVVDSQDVIVHLFRPEVRSFYNLEKMWLADSDETAIVKK